MKQAKQLNKTSKKLKLNISAYYLYPLLLTLPLTVNSVESAPSTAGTLLENEHIIAANPAVTPTKAGINRESIMIGKLDFKQARISDVMRALSDVSNLNIVATEAASKKEISIFLQNISVKEALELISKTSGLWYRQDKNNASYRVMTTEEYQNDLVIYRDDITKTFNILHPNPIIVATAVRDLYPNRVILSLGVEDNTTMGNFGAAGAVSATTRNVGGNTTGLNGARQNNNRQQGVGGLGGVGANRDSRFVEITEKLSAEKLDRIDANMAEQGSENVVSSEALKGFKQSEQPIYITLNREHNLMLVRTSDLIAMKDISTLVKDMDRPTPQVLLEMKILSLEIGDRYRQSFDLDYVPDSQRVFGPPTNQNKSPIFDVAPTNVTTTETSGGTTATTTGVITSGFRNVLGLGNFALEGGTFVYQFMNDKIRARIQLLQEDNKVNTLSSPILLATNNKPARVFVGTEQVITTGFDAVAGATNGIVVGAPAIIPVTEIRNIGNTLQLMPKINADGTVTLLIQQDSSTLLRGSSSIPVPIGNSVVNFNVDSVQTSNIQGTVVAKDGLTIAIGGLIDHSVSDTEQKVPLLGDVPLLGELFKRKTSNKSKRELILLVTPHIVTAPSKGEDVTLDAMGAVSEQEF
jgi:type II secretory pathway component GspD/PulD (secretin)